MKYIQIINNLQVIIVHNNYWKLTNNKKRLIQYEVTQQQKRRDFNRFCNSSLIFHP